MAVDIDFQYLVDKTLSVSAQVSHFVDYALETELAAQLIDERILARAVKVKAYVDGVLDTVENVNDRVGNALETIDNIRNALQRVQNLSNIITFDFQITEDVLNFIAVQLDAHSPVGSGADKHPGLYKSSHVLFADGVQVEDVSKAPNASEFLFVNTQPYSVKIEAGQSSMAPSGVYEVVTFEAQEKFGKQIHIEFFDYVGVFGVMAQIPNSSHGRRTTLQLNKSQNRYPAIRVVV